MSMPLVTAPASAADTLPCAGHIQRTPALLVAALFALSLAAVLSLLLSTASAVARAGVALALADGAAGVGAGGDVTEGVDAVGAVIGAILMRGAGRLSGAPAAGAARDVNAGGGATLTRGAGGGGSGRKRSACPTTMRSGLEI